VPTAPMLCNKHRAPRQRPRRPTPAQPCSLLPPCLFSLSARVWRSWLCGMRGRRLWQAPHVGHFLLSLLHLIRRGRREPPFAERACPFVTPLKVKLLQALDHPNIIKYMDSFIMDNELVIELELAEVTAHTPE
jgi:hypothetical protein